MDVRLNQTTKSTTAVSDPVEKKKGIYAQSILSTPKRGLLS